MWFDGRTNSPQPPRKETTPADESTVAVEAECNEGELNLPIDADPNFELSATPMFPQLPLVPFSLSEQGQHLSFKSPVSLPAPLSMVDSPNDAIHNLQTYGLLPNHGTQEVAPEGSVGSKNFIENFQAHSTLSDTSFFALDAMTDYSKLQVLDPSDLGFFDGSINLQGAFNIPADSTSMLDPIVSFGETAALPPVHENDRPPDLDYWNIFQCTPWLNDSPPHMNRAYVAQLERNFRAPGPWSTMPNNWRERLLPRRKVHQCAPERRNKRKNDSHSSNFFPPYFGLSWRRYQRYSEQPFGPRASIPSFGMSLHASYQSPLRILRDVSG